MVCFCGSGGRRKPRRQSRLKADVGGFPQQKRSQPGCARPKARLAWIRHHFQSFQRGTIMLKWALFFAIVAVIAGLLGFTGVAAGAATIAKFLFVLFLILCVVFLVLGFVVTKKIVD
jgi:uncharacterized membrane protein YtjA (UPF0391 family)